MINYFVIAFNIIKFEMISFLLINDEIILSSYQSYKWIYMKKMSLIIIRQIFRYPMVFLFMIIRSSQQKKFSKVTLMAIVLLFYPLQCNQGKQVLLCLQP